ncbi:MAG: OmpA family protein [Proteobacteria bacterium]|nr:OmpA family protein [Pseudomonadota bacterium]
MMMQERIEETMECSRSALRRRTFRVGAMVLVMGLTACSSLPDVPEVPDYANPVVWYQSTTDMVGEWFTDDEPKIESAGASKKSGGFPNLSSVPEKPAPLSTPEERRQLKNQLVADRANAKYSDAAPSGGAKTAAATTAAAQVAAPKAARKVMTETMVSTVTKTTTQQARISSSPYVGKRSSLWPNAPAPALSGDAARSSNKGGRQAIAPTNRVAKARPATSMASVPKLANPAPAKADAASSMAGADATTPRAPEVPPKFTLTPPAAPPAAPQMTAPQMTSAATSDSMAAPILQLTPPATGNAGQQPMLSFGSESLDGVAGTINFRHGSARLSRSDLGAIAKMARQAVDAGVFIRVVGHASMRTGDMDPFAHTVANFNISLLRANAVASALIKNGVPAERLIVDAVGDTQPLYSEAMPSGEHANRRTEIFLES